MGRAVFATAVQDFQRARSQAALQELLARLTGKPTELLSYEEVRQMIRASGVVSRSLQEIPLGAIVGSVGRYNDFTRTFLPRQDSDQERWSRVMVAVLDAAGVPPIEVYQIGDAYFVHDGHHRISVARKLGNTHIQAYVTEIRSKVPLSPDTSPDELILKAEYVDFLESTQLDKLRPEADLSVTLPGQYQKLLEHIEVHRHYLGLEQERHIPYEEAVAHWYDNVYWPVVQLIRDQGILHSFPERTETDLYLWIAKHRADLEEGLGWEIPYSTAAIDLTDQFGSRSGGIIGRIGRRVLDVVVPDELEAGPAAGQWRQERVEERPEPCLFVDILVPVSSEDVGWTALEQAIEVARREDGRLRGLHVVADETLLDGPEANQMRDRFRWRRGEVGFEGDLLVEAGPVGRIICDRARFADLVVVSLAHPPGSGPLARLGSGFRNLVRRCSRPILAVPGEVSPLSKALLAYDGSPKAREALFVATYLAGHWQMPLVVLWVAEAAAEPDLLNEARQYIEGHGLSAMFTHGQGDVAATILATAAEQGCDWLIMGGYGINPVVEVVLGATIDQVLRASDKPVLICH
jgi:nucleotide-binding universal stress UspA family protein